MGWERPAWCEAVVVITRRRKGTSKAVCGTLRRHACRMPQARYHYYRPYRYDDYYDRPYRYYDYRPYRYRYYHYYY